MKKAAVVVLALIVLAALFAPRIAPFDYARQFRDSPNVPAGNGFLMGTDDLGRDRFSRLIYATRLSILLAPAAAAVSIALALAISVLAAARIKAIRRTLAGFTTLCLSLPWIFLFIILRALLPLNTQPEISILLTFGLMGVAGWAAPARIFSASIGGMTQSGWMLQARASGLSTPRIALVHAWPILRQTAIAQFRILVPAYILSEASLGLLGLGVSEPLPSWGNLLAELEHPGRVQENPWVLAPLGLLMLVMICLEVLQPSREATI
jgi:ABC-type dipeptide/oligopeptide/nickel transport system permease subunit